MLLIVALTVFVLFIVLMHNILPRKDTGAGTSSSVSYLTEPTETVAEASFVSEPEIPLQNRHHQLLRSSRQKKRRLKSRLLLRRRSSTR